VPDWIIDTGSGIVIEPSRVCGFCGVLGLVAFGDTWWRRCVVSSIERIVGGYGVASAFG
jgi:hypothetical protein